MEPYLAGPVPSGEGGPEACPSGHREGPSRTQQEARSPRAGGVPGRYQPCADAQPRAPRQDKLLLSWAASLRGSATPATSHQAGPPASLHAAPTWMRGTPQHPFWSPFSLQRVSCGLFGTLSETHQGELRADPWVVLTPAGLTPLSPAPMTSSISLRSPRPGHALSAHQSQPQWTEGRMGTEQIVGEGARNGDPGSARGRARGGEGRGPSPRI